ncbi:class IV lanthionine synthetase LanL [Streptomyces sp. NPDC086554]|uniref:class IV lanthionine synthetase LanL n=1 Tax=Streptomyces sp. NPDC086554 TaxID=3154864 RepID=UPI00343C527C
MENSSFPLQGLARLVAQREGRDDWTFTTDSFWCRVQPTDHEWPAQGWKLHVSATPLSAPFVLERAAVVLLRAGCAFKFAESMDRVNDLVSTYCPRGSGGKFITAYPVDDDSFRQLAAQLHEATLGLPGPAILSDLPYRPESLVHYRYGAFRGTTVLSNDGSYESMLVGPQGELVNDERNAWFSPPPWARSPLSDSVEQPERKTPRGAPAAVLLNDRFVVREAIQHSNKGGVFRAVDQRTGAEVVVKQARPHVGSLLSGADARDALRNEAQVLDQFEPLGITPRKIAFFEQQGSLFLAEEQITGLSLRQWMKKHTETNGRHVPLSLARRMALQLVDIVSAVHERGLLLRDLTPNNIMVTPSGDLRLIDLEYATEPGAIVGRVMTLAYAAPEQESAPALGPAPGLASDLYALGTTLFYLASGSDPVLPEDRPLPRPARQRIATLLSHMTAHSPTVRAFAPVILPLMAEDPSRRWGLSRVRSYLEGAIAPAPAPVSTSGQTPLTADGQGGPNQLLSDSLSHIRATMDLDHPERLWPSGNFGSMTDPYSVQHGAAGVLQVFTQAARQLNDAALTETVAQIAQWINRRLSTDQRALPGLYFGRSGTAWALYDAGQLLDDPTLTGTALDLAARIPTSWPNPDVCHGVAGAGMAQLHLWQSTGDVAIGARVRACADALLSAAEYTPEGVFWPVPEDFASQLSGSAYYGFGHGVAGIGSFLLAAGLATGSDTYLSAARAAATTLADSAVQDGDRLRWPARLGSPEPSPLPLSWCSGVAGIGAFLARMWQAEGEQRHRDLAEQAGRAVQAGPWHQSSVHCHGLAGSGELLLDLADHLHAPVHRIDAADLASRITARHALRDGRMVVADESMRDVTADYSTGLAGVAAFLLRLRHGGDRLWMPAVSTTVPENGVSR